MIFVQQIKDMGNQDYLEIHPGSATRPTNMAR